MSWACAGCHVVFGEMVAQIGGTWCGAESGEGPDDSMELSWAKGSRQRKKGLTYGNLP